MNKWETHQELVLHVEATDADTGDMVDPETLVLTLRVEPEKLAYPEITPDPPPLLIVEKDGLTRVSQGIYEYIYNTVDAGVVYYRFEGTEPECAVEDNFIVRRSRALNV